MGGSIEVASEVGHGTKFEVRLPVWTAEASAATVKSSPPAATTSKRRILVVDDEEQIRVVLARPFTTTT